MTDFSSCNDNHVNLTPQDVCAGFAKCDGPGIPMTSRGLNSVVRWIEGLIAAIPAEKYLQGLHSYNAATNVLTLLMNDGTTVDVDMTGLVNDAVATALAQVPVPDGSETKVQGAGAVTVSGAGTMASPYSVALDLDALATALCANDTFKACVGGGSMCEPITSLVSPSLQVPPTYAGDPLSYTSPVIPLNGTPPYTLTATDLPAGVTFTDNGDGSFTLGGIGPDFDQNGSPPTMGVIVTNACSSPGVSVPFQIRPCYVPNSGDDGTTGTAGAALSFTSSSWGSGHPVPTFDQPMLPVGVTFTDNGNGTYTIGGTFPPAGSYPITITARNRCGVGTATLTITSMLMESVMLNNEAAYAVGPGIRGATLRLSPDGYVYKGDNTDFTLLSQWLSSGTPSDYEVRATINSGTVNGPVGTWENLGSIVAWSVTDATDDGNEVQADFTVEIRSVSTGTVIATGAWYLFANRTGAA